MFAIDMHTHTRLGSSDSFIGPEELVATAKRVGLDGLCITEHGFARPAWTDDLGALTGFPVFGGMEVPTERGDFLVYGVQEIPPSYRTWERLCEYVVELGGAIVPAHPFRYTEIASSYTLTDLDRVIAEHGEFRLVTALEVYNGFAKDLETEFGGAVARRLGMSGIAGSDAHLPPAVGSCFTLFDNPIATERELVEALRGGDFAPVRGRRVIKR